jgi:hypothetical protein
VANLEQHDEEVGKLPVAEQVPAGLSAKGAARRRFAKAGTGASAGVILTLASQPGMATGLVCSSPSGMLSGNLSRTSNSGAACSGCKPDYWQAHHWAWRGCADGTSQFCYTFLPGQRCGTLIRYSCFDIVDPTKVPNGVDRDVAMHVMATLLNIRSRKIGFLTENQLLGIWNSYAKDGTYTPSVGVTWNGAKIVEYLKSTMI